MDAMGDPFERVVIEDAAARGIVRREHATALADGHFPGDPFLPGAYVLELMVELAERVAAPARVDAIVRCAFARRVRPDTEIVVTARASGGRVQAELATDGEPAASATLGLA
jgi:3-hydroxymyristoyl/3-hydroxydecanoyl-(acyl carrier protein) dehydratase